MLSFVYQLSFSGSLNPRPSLSLSTAASVYGRRGWLLPTLATRGAGNAPKATLTDTTCMRSETITTKMEHMQNTISAVSSALTTRNRGEERTEVRGGREQQRGEERNSEYVLGEIHRQTSPTGVPDCNVINQPTVCMTRDISALRSGMHRPWASLNRRHCRSHIYKTCSPIHTVSRSAPYSTGRSLFECPIPLPAPIGIIETM